MKHVSNREICHGRLPEALGALPILTLGRGHSAVRLTLLGFLVGHMSGHPGNYLNRPF